NEVHGYVVPSVDLAGLVDCDDRRVPEPSDGLGLSPEALDERRVVRAWEDRHECHVAPGPPVPPSGDDAHVALADLAEDDDAAARAFDELADSAVRFPAGVFQLGAKLDDLPRALRALDVRERIALGALLRPTPPRWVYRPEFSLASRPVTNGEYARFLEDPG